LIGDFGILVRNFGFAVCSGVVFQSPGSNLNSKIRYLDSIGIGIVYIEITA